MKNLHTNTLGRRFKPQLNAFGFIRLILACGVIVSHSWDMGGFGHEPFRDFSQGRYTLGRLCVFVFFSISGFLVTRSFDHTRPVVVFIWHRFLRIFPAFWTWLILAVVIFMPLFCWLEHRNVLDFLNTNAQTVISYVTKNLALKIHQWGIPPLLVMTPVPLSFNSSLWSLWAEWQCYMVLAAFGLLARQHALKVIKFIGLPLTWYLGFLNPSSPVEAFNVMPYFFFGAAAYIFRDKLPVNLPLIILALTLILVGLHFDRMPLLGPPGITYAVICMAILLPKKLAWFDQGRDISYGTYIYGFPLQQVLTLAGLHHKGLVIYIVASLAISLAAGFASWTFIEKPALRHKDLFK